MTEMGSGVLEIVARTLIVYMGVLVGLRLMGKRELAQMTVFDLVMILLIANAVQNAMTGPDFSVQGGLIAAAVLLIVNRFVAWLRIHGGVWGRLIEGSPTVLVQNGRFLDPALRKEGLERAQIEMAMREHGIDDASAVKLAVLEIDGSISIVPRDATVIRTRKHVRQIKRQAQDTMSFRRKMKERLPGDHAVSGVPTGIEIIHNPGAGELEAEVGFPEESELLERHGRRIHLIEGRDRIAIEFAHFVERPHGPELVEDRTVYVLPQGTTVFEARRIGYRLLEKIPPKKPGTHRLSLLGR